jgi:uncharacterized membrane protein (DUF373 family)
MMHKLKINTVEKIAKTIIYISIILSIFFVASILLYELQGKSVSVDYNFPFFGLLINIAILVLILVSVYEFIRTYREAAKKNK